MVIAKCVKCGKEYKLKPDEKPSNFQCECGGQLGYSEDIINPERKKSKKTELCTKCGVENPSGSTFCMECGNQLKSMDNLTNSKKKTPQNDNIEFHLREYKTHDTAIIIGWIPFYYANYLLFNPIFEIIIGLYLITRGNVRAKINGKWIIYLTLILLAETLIISLLLSI